MTASPGRLRLEFCGEWSEIAPERPFVIGREGDLVVDDNPYLHRRFLELRHEELWWLSNVGHRLSATLSDGDRLVQAWLAPGARLPLTFAVTTVQFTAGPTVYELSVYLDEPVLSFSTRPAVAADGTVTLGRVTLTPDQRLLVLAVAEPALRRSAGSRGVELPSSAAAAARLGWSVTKFNRKLDNVCQKLASAGVRGLHGGPDQLASGRRARLVEYSLAVRLVTPDDLGFLDGDR